MSKWKCQECGGGGRLFDLNAEDKFDCFWCGGTGRPSFQQAYLQGLAFGQGDQPLEFRLIRSGSSIISLLKVLNEYGERDALNAMFPGDPDFTFILACANQGFVKPLMHLVHRMRMQYDTKTLDGLFADYKASWLIREISPQRGQ